MTGRMSTRLALLGLVLALAPACARPSAPPPVELSTAWPGQASPYADAVARWTRRDEQHDGFTYVMTVSATK